MTYLIADNIISSLGFSTSENFEALKDGRVGIKSIHDKLLYPEAFPASIVDTDKLNSSFSKLEKNASFTRLEKMMILSITDTLGQSDIDIKSERTGIILSTTKGNINLLEQPNSFEKERVLLWRLGEIIGEYFGNPKRVEVLSNACISGVVAINTAASIIESGKYDNVIVCGGDIVSRFVVSGFMSFLSLSPTACKPFDENRDGLSLGEAAGTIILSNAPKQGENIAWLGGDSANDANHISGPSRTGEGSFIAIQKAMKEAGIKSSAISHISAHGTATPYNDEMESIAISRHQMETVPVNSLKGNWGHTLGAAGIIETIALAEEMRQNTLLKTAGFSTPGISKPLNIIDKTQSQEISYALKMASGFGGSNAALVLKNVNEKIQKSKFKTQNPDIERAAPALPLGDLPAGKAGMSKGQRGQITSYCHIKNNSVYLNGKLVFEDEESPDLNAFIKKAYRHIKAKYAKFFKMDDISKLGFLAAEVLLSNQLQSSLSEEEISIVLSNNQSTLVTDSKFQESLKDDNFFPSPSVFVYTLPNIMIGEISIRHKFRGANAFFIFDAFNADFLTEYINHLFATQKTKACIGGWVDQSENNYEAFLYWVEELDTNKTKKEYVDRKTEIHAASATNHTTEKVNKLYNSIG